MATSFQTTDRSTRAVGEMLAVGLTSPVPETRHCEAVSKYAHAVPTSENDALVAQPPTASGRWRINAGIDLAHAFAGLAVSGVRKGLAPGHLHADEMQATLAAGGESGDPPFSTLTPP